MLGRAAAAVFASDEEARLAQAFVPLHRWRALVLGSSVDRPRAPERAATQALLERFPAMKAGKVLLSMGRVHPVKGYEDLIEAFAALCAEHPDWLLALAGPIEDALYAAKLRDLVEARGMRERVVWTGHVGGPAKDALWARASAFVSSSHHESFGMAIVEAISLGLPTIVTDKVNIHGLLGEAQAAIVCEDSAPGLQRALAQLMRMGPDDIARMARRQAEVWNARFRREALAPAASARLAAALRDAGAMPGGA